MQCFSSMANTKIRPEIAGNEEARTEIIQSQLLSFTSINFINLIDYIALFVSVCHIVFVSLPNRQH